jgi:hypothetical protein
LAPFQRITTSLADAEQRTHAEFGHRLFIENFDLDPELRQARCALCKFRGKEDVPRLVDEIARHFDAPDQRLTGFCRLARGLDVAHADRHRRRAALVAILLLVFFEAIGAKFDAHHEIGRRLAAPCAGRRFKSDVDLFRPADLAEGITAERGKIRLRRLLGAAEADNQQAFGLQPVRGEDIDGAQRLSFELRGLRRGRDEIARAAEESARQRSAFEVGADKDNISSALGRGQRRKGGSDEFAH